MSMMMPERLREARLAAGYATAAEAVRAFGWELPAYRHHENGTRGFDVETAKRYARAFKVNPGWLLALDKVQSVNVTDLSRSVVVLGSVAAGLWQEKPEWAEEDRFEIVVGPSPLPAARRFGLRVEGHSMDLNFPPGTILDCLSIFDLGVEPESGDVVIVERIRADGMRERTVKAFHRDDDGRTWLLARSTKPEFQTPIEVGKPDADHDGDEAVQVIAYVIGSYQPHASRLFGMNGATEKPGAGG